MASHDYDGPAPGDRACEAAWTKIMKIAEEYALIVEAAGGVATLAIPSEQRKVPGLRERVLLAHRLSESS